MVASHSVCLVFFIVICLCFFVRNCLEELEIVVKAIQVEDKRATYREDERVDHRGEERAYERKIRSFNISLSIKGPTNWGKNFRILKGRRNGMVPFSVHKFPLLKIFQINKH